MFYLIVSAIMCLIFFAATRSIERDRRKTAKTKYANADNQLRNDIQGKVIRIGMTEEHVVDSWGQPSRRTFKVTKTKSSTTLYFGRYNRVYLNNGYVTGWHGPLSGKR